MEKLKAHYPLLKVKQLIRQDRYRITATARRTAYNELSVDEIDIIQCVLSLDNSNLYKSMISKYDSSLWQDVYHVHINGKIAYMKIQIADNNTIIISFKEK